jgi:hypothetical protein
LIRYSRSLGRSLWPNIPTEHACIRQEKYTNNFLHYI